MQRPTDWNQAASCDQISDRSSMEVETNKGERDESVSIFNELHRNYVEKQPVVDVYFFLGMCYIAAVVAESDVNMLLWQ